MDWFRRRMADVDDAAADESAEAEIAALRGRVAELEARLEARERELEAGTIAVRDALAVLDSFEAVRTGGEPGDPKPAN